MKNKLIVIWSGTPTYKRILFRYNEDRKWRYWQNWKFNFSFSWWVLGWHWNIITPFLRFQKDNKQIYFGLGNHYFEIGF